MDRIAFRTSNQIAYSRVGAHSWILERRNGLARGNYNRLKGGDRFSGKQILAEVQWRPNTLISGSGFPAYQLVFGSNSADLFGWEDEEADLEFEQDAPLSGQFVQQWELRATAREEALKGIADSILRRFLAFNKSFNCTEVKIGDAVLPYKAQRKMSTPRLRRPALILGIDEAGVMVKLQSQVFKVARHCARMRWEGKDVVELDPAGGSPTPEWVWVG